MRREIEWLPVNLLQAVPVEVPFDPVLRLVMPAEADIATPEKRAARLVTLGDGRSLANHRFHPHAVDVAVLAVFGLERHLVERVLADVLGRLEEWIAQRVGRRRCAAGRLCAGHG